MRSTTSWREICAGVVFLGSMTLATPDALAAPVVWPTVPLLETPA